jgi:hypothetical protein
VRSDRREQRVQKAIGATAGESGAGRSPDQAERSRRGTLGERPPSPFGGLPIAEFAIFVGLIAVVVGLIAGGPALIVGVIVVACGVFEVTAREHFAGFRSHASLLAAIPSVGLLFLLGAIFNPHRRAVLLLAVIPVFGLLFWMLRTRFRTARQRRLARPPSAPAGS